MSVFLLSGCRQGKTETGVAAVDSVVVTDTVVAPVKPAKSRTALYLDSLGYLNVAEQDSTIAVDLMYARADNFTGQVLYGDLREAYLHPDAMACLLEAQRLLRDEYPGYRLIVYDAARPMSVQKIMWDKVKGTSKNIYVSNPAHGGGLHNYGLAVDVSILDADGVPLSMGVPVDHMGKESHISYEDEMVRTGRSAKTAGCYAALCAKPVSVRFLPNGGISTIAAALKPVPATNALTDFRRKTMMLLRRSVGIFLNLHRALPGSCRQV